MLRVGPLVVLRRSLAQRSVASVSSKRTGWSQPRTATPTQSQEDEYEEYYEDDEDAVSAHSVTQHLPRSLRRGEFIGRVQLPDALEAALTKHTVPRIGAAIKAANQAKKAGSTNARPPTVDDYATFRLDRSYAGCYRTLHEITCRLPGFTPASVLEFGAYLGAGCWAAHDIWSLGRKANEREYVAVEPNARLLQAGAELSEAAHPNGGPPIAWRENMPMVDEASPTSASAGTAGGPSLFSLVVAPYSLSSLPLASLPQTLELLWSRTAAGGVLAIVESASDSGVGAIKRHGCAP